MANHYHFVARSPEHHDNLAQMLDSLHTSVAEDINALDGRLADKSGISTGIHA